MVFSTCSDCAVGVLMLLVPHSLKQSRAAGRCLVVHSPERLASECYEVGVVLGQGGFGIVHMARDKQCGRECVIKIVDKDDVPDAAQFDSEVEIHASLDHPNIVRIYEMFEEEARLSIVMELCRGGDLCDAVEKRGGICSEGEAKHIFWQVMQAVHYMHCQGLAHRDLKLDNFLIRDQEVSLSTCTVKLIDFGLAGRFFEMGRPSFLTICGTPEYMAPEILGKAPYNEKCDVWSCGVILYTLLSGDMPFRGDTSEELMRNLKKKPVRFQSRSWRSVSQVAQSLVRRTCCKVVPERLSAQQVLADDWLWALGVEAERPVARALDPEMFANAAKFGEMTALQRASLHRVAYHMEDERVGGLRDVFLQLDVDFDGKLTKEELLHGADLIGLPAEESARMAELFDQIDSDGSGFLEYTEFLAAMTPLSKMSAEACLVAFRSFDKDRSGTISVEEIQRVFTQDGADKISTDRLKEAVGCCDTDGDGEIGFEEFRAMLNISNEGSIPLQAAVAA